MKLLFVLLFVLLFSLSTYAKNISPNEVYAQVVYIEHELHSISKYLNVNHEHENIRVHTYLDTHFKPRNTWQKTYEILVKMNILRVKNGFVRIEPIGMDPVLDMNPDLVYEQTQRILTEIKIFKHRKNIKSHPYKIKKFNSKTPSDVYSALSDLSETFDEIYNDSFSATDVFSESMRIHDDISVILQHLNIEDNTIPFTRSTDTKISDIMNITMQIIDNIKILQNSVNIETIDFSMLNTKSPQQKDVYTLIQMLIAELQTIKAYIGLTKYVTIPALKYNSKTSAEVEQIMTWNLKKIQLINSLTRK